MKKGFILGATVLASSLLFNLPNSQLALAVPNSGDIVIEALEGDKTAILSEKDGLWQPGNEKIKDFFIINNSNDNIKVKSLKFTNIALRNASKGNLYSQDSKEFKEFMKHSSIKLMKDNKEVFNGDLNKAFDKSGIILESPININSNKKEKMQLNFAINKEAGNELQDLQNEFSLSITYELAENTEDNGGNNSGNNGGNSNQQGGNGNQNNNLQGNNNGTMPQTGQLLSAGLVGIIGVGILSLGAFIIVKSKKKDGEKNDKTK